MSNQNMTVATAVAIASLRPEVSAKARELARDAIIDTLAGMWAGRHDASVASVVAAFMPRAGQGTAKLVTGGSANPMLAAMINATSAHALDFDDNFMPGMSHASAVLVPAILALADFAEVSGSRIIDAYLAGLQAQALVGEGVGQAHYTAGWHGTSTIGSIGTAVATSVMLGLDAAATARAISIATSLACGTKGQFGTMIKPVHAGLAARNAVEAALLAQAGLAAKPDILEGEQGFHELFAGDPRQIWAIDAILAERQHVIETIGVMPKRHPCCGSTHLIVDALLDLMAEHGFSGDDVAVVDALVGIANYRNLPYSRPIDEMQARFSMQYCVAGILRQGYLSLADFTPDAVARHGNDPRHSTITMRSYTADEERAAPTKLPHIATVTLKDGRQYSKARPLPVGTLQQPFSVGDRSRKFADCCADVPDSEALYRTLQGLNTMENITELNALFVQ